MSIDLEIWKTIPSFPNYAVSNYGRVFNIKKDVEMVLSRNQDGTLTVGLSREGLQRRRSVKVIVAELFVDGQSDLFDTVIHLDGDDTNIFAHNLAWRPRWFAWKYRKQFDNIPGWAYTGPVVDRVNGQSFGSIIDAACNTGSLLDDIRASLSTGKAVFPTDGVYSYA
jgi:hypothetical protein